MRGGESGSVVLWFYDPMGYIIAHRHTDTPIRSSLILT